MKFLLIASAAFVALGMNAVPAAAQSVAVTAPTEAFEGSIGIDLKNKYLFKDMYVGNEGTVVQPYGRITHSESGLYFDAWASLGIESKDGNELDLKVGKSGEDYDVSIAYWDIPGPDDIVAASVSLKSGPFTITAEHYRWKVENGNRLMAEYQEAIGKTDVTVLTIYETGLAFPDIVVGGVEASYPLGKGFSVNGMALFALKQSKSDPRDSFEGVVGFSWNTAF